MKKFCITLAFIFIIVLTAVVFSYEKPSQNAYLRIHIRANSDTLADQAVKYQVRDTIVELLTPYLADCHTKLEAREAVAQNLSQVSNAAAKTLSDEGFTYGAKSYIKSEEFPLRIYGDLTLESGVYDALIIELGQGGGANWWCVIYPPLCFTGEGGGAVKYRSKILEIIKNFKDKRNLT